MEPWFRQAACKSRSQLFFPSAGLPCAAGTQLSARRSVLGHVQGADGGDPYLGTVEAKLPPRLHSNLRHPGQHVPPLQAPN